MKKFPGAVKKECVSLNGDDPQRFAFVCNEEGEYVHTSYCKLKAGDFIMLYEPDGTYVKNSTGTITQVEQEGNNYRLFIQPEA